MTETETFDPPAARRDPDARPLYLQTHGARLARDGERLRITLDGVTQKVVRLSQVSHVILIGNVKVTTPCLHALLRLEIPVSWHDGAGWYLGRAAAPGREADARLGQYRDAHDPVRRLAIARALVAAKIANSLTRLRRVGGRALLGSDPRKAARTELARLQSRARAAAAPDTLFGIEGTASRTWFDAFGGLIAPPDAQHREAFCFSTRTRRPPADPVNALLSYAYGVLLRAVASAVETDGLDPAIGFLHVPTRGRPSLALDLMEPFRPLLADSVVLRAINTGAVTPSDFERHDEGIRLSARARRAVITGFETRMDQTAANPYARTALSYREIVLGQCRSLSRHLRDPTHAFAPFQAS